MVLVLMMSLKSATLGFLEIKVFPSKGYNVLILCMTSLKKFYHATQITLWTWLCDQSLVTLAFLWEQLSEPQRFKNLTRKTFSFEGRSWYKFNNVRLALGMALRFYTSLAKILKLKIRKFWGLIPTFVEVTGGKWLGGVAFLHSPLPILNRVNILRHYRNY